MNTRKTGLAMLAWLVVLLTPVAAMAGGSIDETGAITGTVERLIEIHPQRIIENIDPDTVGLPKKFIIDLNGRTMRGTPDSLVRRVVKIRVIDRLEDKLILSGADEGVSGTSGGLAWSLAIERATGKAVLSAAGSGIAYVAFGTCAASAPTS